MQGSQSPEFIHGEVAPEQSRLQMQQKDVAGIKQEANG